MDGLRVAKVERVVLEGTARDPPHDRIWVEGTLHLTPHHLFFSPDAAANAQAAATSVDKPGPVTVVDTSGEIWIPYPTINVLQRLPQSASGKYPLLVGTKTFDTYTLLFEKWGEGGAEDVWYSVRDCAVTQSVEQLYAFFYTLPKSPAATTSALAPSSPSKGTAPLASPTTPTPAASVANPLSPLSSSPETPSPVAPAAVEAVSAIPAAPPATGWGVYNPRTEFARQGVGSRTRAWRFTDVNRDYSFCPTYPAKIVVPTRISDSVLVYAGKYRSKARIPALSYLHWGNHASITRSSQPMVGIKGNRSAQDERLVECIFTSHQAAEGPGSAQLTPSPSSSNLASPLPGSPVYGATCTNLIIDARPTTNAMANVAKGAGTENMDHYRSGVKAYLGIDNIHVMRNSLKAIVETLAEASAGSLPVDRERLRRSGWLKHLTAILDGSLMIVRNIHINSSHVLIHCSDGWDRTSQLSAIAQLCLDPYYRTLDGFRVLVEKDWLSFGHMFQHRSGHLSSSKLFTATPDNIDSIEDESDDDFGLAVKGAQAFFASVSKSFSSSSHLKEISPVFHQFLDCVRQIQRQFPGRFEFNEDYLLDMHYHLYACQFGTFLFDNERQRRVPQGSGKPYVERTVSAWEWFDQPAQRSRYLNPDYKPELDDRSARGHDADLGVLLPDPRDVRFWHRLFKRSDEEMNMPETFREPAAPALEALVTPTPTDAREVKLPKSPLASSAPLPYQPRVTHAHADPNASPLAAASSLAQSPLTVPTRPEAARTTSSTSAASLGRLGGQKWNWSSVSTGALSAFNQIRSGATDAFSQFRERSDDDWGGSNAGSSTGAAGGEMAGFEPGTGIGEGRKVRGPLHANPWDDPEPAATGLRISGGQPQQTLRETQAERRNGAGPARSATADLAANPWSDSGATGPSLSDLKLGEDVPGTGKSAFVKTDSKPAPEPRSDMAPANNAEIEAALGGSKAWDPLGAAT